MILDSSALVAILFKEPEAERLAATIRDTDTTAIAAPTLLETAIVAEGRTLPGMAEKLDGDQRLAVLRAKDRALKQANDQADEQFMDANQKLANRMAELQESMKKAQAAGDMAGVNRFQAALGIEAKKIAALGTFQQGSNLATLNEYGSQEWAQARVRALDTDNRSDADKYKEGLDKLNAINEQTGKDVKRMADAVERLGIPQPVSLGKR